MLVLKQICTAQNGSLFPHNEATENKTSLTFKQWPGSKAYPCAGLTAG